MFFFFQAEDGIRDVAVTGFRRVLFRSRVDEVGDEVVAALELDVDLLERVERLVLEGDEPVVRADQPADEDDQQNEKYYRAHGRSRFENIVPYALSCGMSFARACRTASATALSSGPSRASGCAASTCSSMPCPTGIRRHELGTSGSRWASRVIHAVSARPALPR